MMIENIYLENRGKDGGEDSDGDEFEWIDFPTIDGVKKIKKYKNKNHL